MNAMSVHLEHHGSVAASLTMPKMSTTNPYRVKRIVTDDFYLEKSWGRGLAQPAVQVVETAGTTLVCASHTVEY